MCVLTVVTVLSAMTTARAQTPPVLFEDASHLLDFARESRSLGGSGLGGAAWLDFDNDGYLDLFLTNGKTQPNALFRNNADGTFTDVAQSAGVDNGLGNSGVVAGDIDNDGFKDLFLTGDGGFMGTGQSTARLYHNNGDGTFTEMARASGVVQPTTAMSAAFGDIDGDGFLDLFITAPGSGTTGTQHRNKLFRNNGDLTFEDISASAGVDTMLGACVAFFTDYDNDGWIDLLVGDCNDTRLLPTPIELFHNNGDLTFTDVAATAGLTPGGYWMGFAPADFDNDGDIDMFVTNSGTSALLPFPHALYENRCGGTYTNTALIAGLTSFKFGWGCTATDFDNDGYTDIYFAGSLPDGPMNIIGPGHGNPGNLLFNDRRSGFTDFTSSSPVNLESRNTSGVASGDFDNDGFADIVVVTEPYADTSGQPVLLHNLGNDNNWITLRLEGTISNRDAVGARVEVISGDLSQTREVYAGSSFLSTETPWLTFGLASHAATDKIRVRWPGGAVEEFPNVEARQTVTLIEGDGTDSEQVLRDPCVEQVSRQTPSCGSGILAMLPAALPLALLQRRLRSGGPSL